MLVNQIIYNVSTGKTRIGQIEIEDVVEELELIQPPTLEERINSIEKQLSVQSTILSEEVNKIE